MPLHKQIHIRLTSSFDKWLQNGFNSRRTSLLTIREDIFEIQHFFFKINFLFFFKQLALIQKKKNLCRFQSGLCRWFGCLCFINWKHMVFLADTLLILQRFPPTYTSPRLLSLSKRHHRQKQGHLTPFEEPCQRLP